MRDDHDDRTPAADGRRHRNEVAGGLRIRSEPQATSPAAAGLFATASYWRDLVSFTWNLKTVENPDGVTDLLTHNLDRVAPSEFELSRSGGHRRRGHRSLVHVRHLGGTGQGARPPHRRGRHQGLDPAHLPAGARPATKSRAAPGGSKEPSTAWIPDRKSWSEKLAEEDDAWGHTADPYILVVGGGTGWNRPRRSPPAARSLFPRHRPVGSARRPMALTI
jgi:hypothetical protein